MEELNIDKEANNEEEDENPDKSSSEEPTNSADFDEQDV